MSNLALFPLGTVLAPGAHLPLRVFEPRYVALLRTLLTSSGPPEFGVIAIRSGHEVGAGNATALYDVGCSAVLEHVEDLGDGSYDVRTRAVRRFRVEEILPDSPHPYLEARVTWLGEAVGNRSRVEDLARLVRSRLLAYRMLVGAETDLAEATGAGARPLDAEHLSHRVGELVLLPLADRQRLLECATTQERLDLARRLIRREHRLVSTLHAFPRPLDPSPISAN